MECVNRRAALLDFTLWCDGIRDALQFLHPFSLREGASEAREQMDVVFHAEVQRRRTLGKTVFNSGKMFSRFGQTCSKLRSR